LIESPLERNQASQNQNGQVERANRSTVRWLLLFPPIASLPKLEGAVPVTVPESLQPWTDDFGSPIHAIRGVKL
jgi:hypothetical protein